MSRKNFLSSDFFVTASEVDAKKAVANLPAKLHHISLLKENALLNSMRFLFDDVAKKVAYYIDVSMLPLNDQYVRFSLHISYTNGQGIHSNSELSWVLQEFEKSIQAAVNNDFSSLEVEKNKKIPVRRPSYFATILQSFFFSKYHY